MKPAEPPFVQKPFESAESGTELHAPARPATQSSGCQKRAVA